MFFTRLLQEISRYSGNIQEVSKKFVNDRRFPSISYTVWVRVRVVSVGLGPYKYSITYIL